MSASALLVRVLIPKYTQKLAKTALPQASKGQKSSLSQIMQNNRLFYIYSSLRGEYERQRDVGQSIPKYTQKLGKTAKPQASKGQKSSLSQTYAEQKSWHTMGRLSGYARGLGTPEVWVRQRFVSARRTDVLVAFFAAAFPVRSKICTYRS